jgi:DNA-binding NtrC family response regulator
MCSDEVTQTAVADLLRGRGHEVLLLRSHAGAISALSSDNARPARPSSPDNLLPTRRSTPVFLKEIARKAAERAERREILKMLERTRWNRVRAAKLLNISYRALLYKMKGAGLDRVAPAIGSRTPQSSRTNANCEARR